MSVLPPTRCGTPPANDARRTWYVLAGTAAGMLAYEVVKTALAPGLTLWESHAITVAFSSVAAALAARLALGNQARLHRRLIEEAAGRERLEARESALLERARELQAAEAVARDSEERFRSVARAATDAIVTTDAQNRVVFWNSAAERTFGYAAADIVGESLDDLVPAARRVVHDAGAPFHLVGRTVETEGVRKDGATFPMEMSLSQWEAGGETFFTSIIRDVTARREAARAARESDERLRLFVEQIPAILHATDAELRFTSSVGKGLAMLGLEPNEVVGRTFAEYFGIDDPEFLPIAAGRRALRGERVGYEMEWCGRVFQSRVEPLCGRDGAITGTIALSLDVTERARGEAALRASDARFRAVFDEAAIGIVLIDAIGRVVDTNPAFQGLLGYSTDELRGRASRELWPAEDANVLSMLLRELATGQRPSVTVEQRFLRADDQAVWGSLTLSRLDGAGSIGDDDGPGGAVLVGMVQDVTARKALEAELAHQAFHDPLTGLANRTLFRDRVEHALSRLGRADARHERAAVLFLDLDDFKMVNDSLGHAAGDALLETVARRLLSATRGCDTVGRLGGDEFAVLLEGMAEDGDVQAVVERIYASLRVPVALDGTDVRAAASIGVAYAHGVADADKLLRNADVAMYHAKAAGKGRHAVFEPAMHAAVLARIGLERDLRRAVSRLGQSEEGEFFLVYQPVVELADGRIVGLEALLRWQHPTRGLVSPAHFIPAAEETGLIVPLGLWVLRTACAQLGRWKAAFPDGCMPSVAVNLSGRQLEDDALVGDIAAVLAETGVEPERLTLEITESIVMRRTDETLDRLYALKALGVRLAIDDFGTGYSSLAYLQKFPVDVLKIDKMFVDGVARGGSDAALARTIVALGEMLQLRTVAEGVEHAAQRDELAALGCHFAQGYLFARPLSVADATQLLAEAWRPRPTAGTLRLHSGCDGVGKGVPPNRPRQLEDADGTRGRLLPRAPLAQRDRPAVRVHRL